MQRSTGKDDVCEVGAARSAGAQERGSAATDVSRAMGITARALPKGRIAIVVGVRAEGSPSERIPPGAADAFRTILDDLNSSSPRTPLVVLSTISTPAGRLALEIAAERDLACVACLSVAAETFLGEMNDPDERAEAGRALERCGRIDVAVGGEVAYVASFADVLVTFANGSAERPAADAGFADDAVLYRIECLEPVERGADPSEASDVRVVTSFPARFSGDDFASDVAAARTRIDQYNADLERDGMGARDDVTIDDLCDRTSEIASRLQRTTFRFLFALYATAIVATAAQYTTSQIFKYAMLPIAFVTYRIARRFDYENRYQDYRAFGEGLRVQAAWFDGGLYEEQSHRSYLGMQERELLWIRMALRYAYFAFRPAGGSGERSPVRSRPWIDGQVAYFKKAARREERRLASTGLLSRCVFWGALSIAALILIVLDAPTAPGRIASVAASLAGAAHAMPGFSAWLTSVSGSAESVQHAWNGAPAWSTGWFGALRLWSNSPAPHGWLVRLSTGVFALYAAVALLISNYNDKRGFAVNVKRYDRMFVVFERAQVRLDALAQSDIENARDVVRVLGRAALIENADWLLTRRERPIAFVQ